MADAELGDAYRQLLEAARRAAHEDWWHEFVGTEHLLMAVLADDPGPVSDFCRGLGADPAAVRADLAVILERGPGPVPPRHPDLPPWDVRTPRAKAAVELARGEADRLGHRQVGPVHVLLGLLRDEKGLAGQILRHHGLRLKAARQRAAGE